MGGTVRLGFYGEHLLQELPWSVFFMTPVKQNGQRAKRLPKSRIELASAGDFLFVKVEDSV